ncbi:MAG: HAMP domain-containing sensor histidine kinase [Pseudomonadota bacterium]
MKWKWSTFDLQIKTIILACVGLGFLLCTFALVYVKIESLNRATLNLELAEDLYDSIHEMRRYEKNFLLYHGQDNLDQTVIFFDKARQIFLKMVESPDLSSSIKPETSQFDRDFQEYSHVVEYFRAGNAGTDEAKTNQDKIRAAGNQMIELAKAVLSDSRTEVARTAHRAIRLPLASTGLVTCLFLIGLFMINRKVIRPLVMLEQATGKIGRGDFGPISHMGGVENEVERLVFAFNRMVEELDARQEQIIHARKIASLGTLVSGVAHELNNPINNIILTVDTLVGKRQLTEERRGDLLEDILAQAIRASDIVKNLLAFSRAEVSSMQDVNMLPLLNDIFKIIDNDLTLKKIRLHREIDPGLPVIWGNRQGLQQVFFNLIINAVQAMAENGELTIKGFLGENRWVVVTVEDTGVGIPEEVLPHIFDPFFTTKEVGKGTGLGLSVSYGIIKKHGGRISVKSKKDCGTTFTVALPAKEDLSDE